MCFLFLGCPVCTEEYIPVCGLDGNTYGSLCKLQQQNCINKGSIVVAYQGECSKWIRLESIIY